MLLIASWLIRITRNCQTLNPPNNHSSPKEKEFIMPLTFFPSRFSKVKSLTAIKFLLHILIYFSLQLGNVSKNVFWCSLLSLFAIHKENIWSYFFYPFWIWNLCYFSFSVFYFLEGLRQMISVKPLIFRGLNGKDQMPSADMWQHRGRGWRWRQNSRNSRHFSAKTTQKEYGFTLLEASRLGR